MPDQVTTLAALAALASGPSRIRGVAVTRGHETDRLAALATELAKLGVTVTELPDGLVVDGPGPDRLRPARLATWGDHRMAMALAAVAARVPGVVLEDPACVAKTYPGFWDDLAAAGLAWRALPGRVQ
jgi:3-phosphoshikimate 1-carboxyvinyltransferase